MTEKNKIPVAGCCVCPKCGAELQIEVKPIEPAGTQPNIE